jgi:hypothetical protein
MNLFHTFLPLTVYFFSAGPGCEPTFNKTLQHYYSCQSTLLHKITCTHVRILQLNFVVMNEILCYQIKEINTYLPSVVKGEQIKRKPAEIVRTNILP